MRMPEDVDNAFARLNGYSFKGVPMQLHKGRSWRVSEGKTTAASLRTPRDSPAFRWQDIKDQLTQYTPVLSVDALTPTSYRVRYFTAEDYEISLQNLRQSGLQLDDGTRIPVQMRLWVRREAPNDSFKNNNNNNSNNTSDV